MAVYDVIVIFEPTVAAIWDFVKPPILTTHSLIGITSVEDAVPEQSGVVYTTRVAKLDANAFTPAKAVNVNTIMATARIFNGWR